MNEEYASLNDDEKLKADNEFLKLKLMLERGAKFGDNSEAVLPAEIENRFLRNIIEYENASDVSGYTTVFKKIGSPAQFPDHASISDDNIKQVWNDLSAYLFDHGVSVGVCSPRVTARQLYRFVTEELFNEQIIAGTFPGMLHGFIYDEFHPDAVHDNTCAAVNDCMQQILNDQPFEWMFHFVDSGIRLNDHFPVSKEQFKSLINAFKLAYDKVEDMSITNINCTVDNKYSAVKGEYTLNVSLDNKPYHFAGNWIVEFELDDRWGYWYINHVTVQNINF